MRRLLPAVLLLSAVLAPAAEPKTPSQAVAAVLSFKEPKGWTLDQYANAGGADPVVRYENLSDAVQVRLFGAPGSDYPTAKDFMAGAASSEEGHAPSAAGTAVVAGKTLPLYKRRFPMEARDPHRPTAPSSLKGTEIFCVLPLKGGRYAVLAYRRETPVPDMKRKGEKAWEAFLKTVRPR